MTVLTPERRSEVVTRRWDMLPAAKLTPKQLLYMRCDSRFIIVPAGRRSGKTEIAKRKLVIRSMRKTKYDDAWYVLGAPTHKQAKRIFWDDIKSLFPREYILKASETELTIWLANGDTVTVLGLDKPERIEGKSLNGIIIDEFASIKPSAWEENIRPALSDRLGWAILLGVPEGRNHYYTIYNSAIADESGEWAAFHWPSSDVLPESEVESARRALDPLTFQQEYEGSFVNFTGLAYYTFRREIHAAQRLPYVSDFDIAFCFDFNVSPGVAVVVQELPVPLNGERPDRFGRFPMRTCAIDEVYIPRNSRTESVCRKLIELYSDHRGRVILYGDATGGAASTTQTRGNDWDQIRSMLSPIFGDRLVTKVGRSNPTERARVNSVNARLRTDDGTIHFLVDPISCPHLIDDLERTTVLEGGSGEIDKRADKGKWSHSTDALGYYIEHEHPMSGQRAMVRKVS